MTQYHRNVNLPRVNVSRVNTARVSVSLVLAVICQER